MAIQDFAEGVADWEAAVEDGEELVADLGLDGHAVGRIYINMCAFLTRVS